MKKAKKIFRFSLIVLLISYVALCLGYSFFQKYFLMTNTKPSNYVYQFEGNFEERNVQTRDGKKLNGLLFKSDSSNGLIFYLHGGGHTLEKWGKYAKTYTDLHYDIFFLDYRGFGKSQGDLPTEKQLYSDVQDAYNNLKTTYREDNIIVFGYSFGTAPASMLSADNKPRMLILQAPYYSGDAAVKENYPFLYSIIPTFLLKYKLKTYEFLERTKVPIVIFHGNKDSTFNVSQSYKLKKLFKSGDELIVLENQGHNGFTENKEYLKQLTRVLSK
ncbi:MAG: alpha/beta fold hydrolase [Bacteroidota bacterium]